MKLSERVRGMETWFRDGWQREAVRDCATKVAQLEAENERLLQLEVEIKKMLTPDPNFKGTLPSWEPIKALLR